MPPGVELVHYLVIISIVPVCDKLPLLPVMVRVKWPIGVVTLWVWTPPSATVDPPAVSVAGDTSPVDALGRPLMVKVTVPLKPPTDCKLTSKMLPLPLFMVMEA